MLFEQSFLNLSQVSRDLSYKDNGSGWPWTEEVNANEYDHDISWPKISIVTPSFNQGHFIEETIRSVLLQNYPNLEYIVIDGGSTDNTIEILKKYDHLITYWVSEPDSGQSDAINKGISKATGEIFNWLNSDDYYLPRALKRVAEYFIENDVDVVCGNEYLKLNNDYTLTTGSTIKETQAETIFHAHIDQPPTFFKLEKVKEIGGVNRHLHFLMDAELWLRYLFLNNQDRILKVKDSFNVFRLHEASKTSSLIEKFSVEKAFIRYLYLGKTGLSQQLLEKIFDVRLFENYIRNKAAFDWKFKVDKKIIENAKCQILKYYGILAYMDRDYQQSKEILNHVSRKHIFKDRTLFFLIVKLYTLPNFILNFTRNIKNKKALV